MSRMVQGEMFHQPLAPVVVREPENADWRRLADVGELDAAGWRRVAETCLLFADRIGDLIRGMADERQIERAQRACLGHILRANWARDRADAWEQEYAKPSGSHQQAPGA